MVLEDSFWQGSKSLAWIRGCFGDIDVLWPAGWHGVVLFAWVLLYFVVT